MKHNLFRGVGLAAMAAMWSVNAMAQESTTATDEADAGDEIIVTATLRAENLQEVPLAVSAYNAESLATAGVNNIANLSSVSASFNANSTNTESSGTTIRLRGVGTTGNNTGLESAVGVFIDGVYLSRPGIALGDLLDVAQVEVLRGPQGTLFGRNTSAGALNIRTAKPNFNEFEGFANATYGNYDLVNLQGGVSAPLVEGQLGFRLSGAYRGRDGTLRNATGGDSNSRNRYIVRSQLAWEPTADLSFRLIGDYSASNERCCDAVILRESSYARAGIYAVSGLSPNGGVPNSGPGTVDARLTSNNTEFRDRIRQWGVSGQFDWDLGDANLTSITAYRNSRARISTEADFVSANVFSTSNDTSSSTANSGRFQTNIKTFSQEVRIAGTAFNDKVDYLFGAYYLDEKINELQALTLGADHQAYISAALTSVGVPGPNPARNIFAGGVSSQGDFANNRFTQSARNFSIFTNNTVHLSDAFSVNFGLRYSDDKKDASFNQESARSNACSAVNARAPLFATPPLSNLVPLARALTCFPFTTVANSGVGTPVEFDRTFKDNELNYTLKLLWKPAYNINAYASVTHGYKSGGFNLDPSAAVGGGNPAFKSETVDAYEIGLKTKWLDNALTANIAVFDMHLKDFQVLEFTGVQFTTFNVDKARSTGVELELDAKLSSAFRAFSSVTYTDARYPSNCAGTATTPLITLLCGNSLTNAPKWVAIAGFDFDQDLGNDLTFGLNAQVRMESDRRTSTQAVIGVAAGTGTEGAALNLVRTPVDIQDGNAKVNLRAGIGRADNGWRIEVWGENIFDVNTYGTSFNVPLRGVSTLPGPLNAGGIGLARGAYLQDPRTYGVTLRTRF